MKKILLVEDDIALSAGLCFELEEEDYLTVAAHSLKKAGQLLETSKFDLLLLDVDLPDGNGFTFYKEIKKRYTVPVMFLTGRKEEEDVLGGYDLGADDYVTKPFTMSVLYAKTMALIKRNQRSVLAGDRMEVSGITLELTAGRAYAGGKEVFLTPKEFALLRCLMQNKNLVMSREQLLVKCWGYDYEGESRAVDTHIKRLREKLGDYAECIKTVIKAGYRLEG